MDYTCKSLAVTTTPASVLDAAEFDRELVLGSSGESVYVGFDDTDMARIQQTFYLGNNTVGRQTRFVLPAGKELWAKTGSGTLELDFIAAVAP